MSSARTSKRAGKKAPLVRGEAVVRKVLGAALAELGRTGYGALRIDDVAASAGVNKTTVYRRWPTKEDLVRAALLSITSDRITAPKTGALRTDLLEIARRMATMTCSSEGQGIMRMIIAEGPDSELLTIARSLRETFEAVPRSVIEAAEVRGEIAPGIDGMLLFDVLAATLHRRLLMEREAVDDGYLRRLLDLLLLGALAPRERATPSARRASKARRR